MAGEVAKQQIDASEDGAIAVNELRSNSAEIKNSGDGYVSLWGLETMYVEISGDGNISYLGNPEVRQKNSGDGSLVSVNG